MDNNKLGTNLAEVGTDCISREQAIDAVEFGITYARAFNKETGEVKELFKESNDELRKAVERIRQLPPILPAEPKRGKWIKTARWGRVYYCNQCRNYLDFDGVNAGRGSTNFCPNCGADMRGEQDDSV